MKMKVVNIDRVDKYYGVYPDRFLEDILGIKLHLYQKLYLRTISKINKRGIY